MPSAGSSTVCATFIAASSCMMALEHGADGGQAVGYFLGVPGRRFPGGRID